MSEYLQLQAPRPETILGLVLQRLQQRFPNSHDLIEVVNLQARQKFSIQSKWFKLVFEESRRNNEMTSMSRWLWMLMSVNQFVTCPWKEDLASSMGMVRCPTPASRVTQMDLMLTCRDHGQSVKPRWPFWRPLVPNSQEPVRHLQRFLQSRTRAHIPATSPPLG